MMTLHQDYPWLTPGAPVLVASPMMKICMSKLTTEVAIAGGVGFLAAGFDVSNLANDLSESERLLKEAGLSTTNGVLPLGVGFQNWGADLQLTIKTLKQHPVAAVWFFGPKKLTDLVPWTEQIRAVSKNRTKIWVQVGTVAEALDVVQLCKPDVLVVQGADSGGHGLAQRASIITLLPEVADALEKRGIRIPLIAAGGIIEGRGAAAAISLGADGVCLGTRLLACSDAIVADGYRNEILRASDGGANTVSTTVYDAVRGIKGWPKQYVGRGVVNQTFMEVTQGRDPATVKALHDEQLKKGDNTGWGPEGRLTTYAGTGVGLVRSVKSAKEIVQEIQRDAAACLRNASAGFEQRSKL